MNDEEQIAKLQEELNRLNEQAKSFRKTIDEMQQRLVGLSNTNTAPAKEIKEEHHPSLIIENFIGLRLIHFAGIVVLVIGLSIGVKYAIDKNLVSEAMRVALAYGAGIILYLLSLRLKKKYVLFSAILFSGGMASLYFTTYASYVYYSLFSFALAFIIMVFLTVYTVYEALRYNRSEIALLGLTGAYGIPFLISHNSDRADLYFLYITLINTGIIVLYVKKGWKSVMRVANIITWILFLGWCIKKQNAVFQTTGMVFLFFFFLLFLFSTISLKLFWRKKITSGDNNYIAFNNLALYSGALILSGFSITGPYLALVTISMSVFLLIQSLLVKYIWSNEVLTIRMLSAFSLILFVLFIAFEWKGFSVTVLWLLTAVLLFVFGAAMKWGSMRMASIILMAITLFKLVVFDSLSFTTLQKVISYISLGILLLVVSFFYQKFRGQLFDNKHLE